MSQANGTTAPSISVYGYHLESLLGSGGIAHVYLGRASSSRTRPQLVAIKVVPLSLAASSSIQDKQEQEQAKKKARKEFQIHDVLKHSHILRLFKADELQAFSGFPTGFYVALEFAPGGDLFDKITPDAGVDEEVAHLYFYQLINGIKYIADKGICHRDIKPENILLSASGDLKISDFGLATVYKHKGQERLLLDKCGSPPYAAPELALPDSYRAQPIDIWSAGVVLFALLLGNTPWDEPTVNSPEYAAYLDGSIWSQEPWTRLGTASSVTQLLRRLLDPDPNRRATIRDIELNGWFCQQNPLMDSNAQCAKPLQLSTAMLETLHRHNYMGEPTGQFANAMSIGSRRGATAAELAAVGIDTGAAFTSSLRLYSRLSMAPSQRAQPNLNRFFTLASADDVFNVLVEAMRRAVREGTSGGGLVQAVRSEQMDAPNGELEDGRQRRSGRICKIRFTARDDRRQFMLGAVLVDEEFLPPTAPDGSFMMDLDGADGEEGDKGLVVVFSRKQGDPLAFKKLYREVLLSLPHGFVHCT